jgi:hypothetical protein
MDPCTVCSRLTNMGEDLSCPMSRPCEAGALPSYKSRVLRDSSHHTTTHQKCEGSAESESAGAEFTAADA